MQNAGLHQTARIETNIITQAFAWMFGGLLLTGVTALYVAANTALITTIISNQLLFFGLLIAEIALVFFLSLRIMKLSFEVAIASFAFYSFLNGVTLSVIFLAYTSTSIATTFLITAGVFGSMAVYGYTTKRDLTTVGNLAIMALIGVIIASIVNIFLRSELFSYVLSYVAVAIFIGLTAYDTQKIKRMGEQTNNANVGVLGALMLYLDFINIFLNLLRIFGRRR